MTTQLLRPFRAALALLRLMRDPNSLDQVFALANALATPTVLRSLLAAFEETPIGKAALAQRLRIQLPALSELAQLPPGSLGFEFAAVIRRRGLESRLHPAAEGGYTRAMGRRSRVRHARHLAHRHRLRYGHRRRSGPRRLLPGAIAESAASGAPGRRGDEALAAGAGPHRRSPASHRGGVDPGTSGALNPWDRLECAVGRADIGGPHVSTHSRRRSHRGPHRAQCGLSCGLRSRTGFQPAVSRAACVGAFADLAR